MTHVNLLDISIRPQSIGDWLNLFVLNLVLEQVQITKWQNLEEVRKCVSADLVIINIDITEVGFVL